MGSDKRTKEVLVEMLKQNTGRALCDSGGTPKYDENGNYVGSSSGYGRNFERHAKATLESFEAQPQSVADFKRGEVSVTHNVFHWLAERLTFDEARDKEWQEFCNREENKEEPGLALVDAYLEHLAKLSKESQLGKTTCCNDCNGDYGCNASDDYGGCECHKRRDPPAGIYGDGEPLTVNTYNNEDLLSQTVQYAFWTEDHSCPADRKAYVLLATHNGADVRGGYSMPRLFEVTGESDETCIFDNARASICCDNSECPGAYGHAARWFSDDGYNWSEEEQDFNSRIDIKECARIEASDELYAKAKEIVERLRDDEKRQLKLFKLTDADRKARMANRVLALPGDEAEDSDDFKVKRIALSLADESPLLRYTEDGKGYCPRCKEGRLESWFY